MTCWPVISQYITDYSSLPAASRIRDHRHHPWDVTAGFVLGSMVALAMLVRVTAELRGSERTYKATRSQA